MLGTTISLDTSNVPVPGAIGVTIFSLTKHDPGIDLSGLGMPGCRQLLNLDASLVFFPVGGSASQVAVR